MATNIALIISSRYLVSLGLVPASNNIVISIYIYKFHIELFELMMSNDLMNSYKLTQFLVQVAF